jgi:glycerol uptake facilitator-like aquaporin
MESSMTCMEMLKYSFSKIIFEFVGTALFTMFFTSGSQSVILAGLFLMTCFCWKISGSHFNPAVTFAFMLRRGDAKFPISRGLMYIVAQLLGGLLGALLVNFYTLNLKVLEYTDPFIIRATLQELLASFVYVIFFLSQTDATMLFSKEAAINCFILASCYVSARAIFFGQTSATCWINLEGDKQCS